MGILRTLWRDRSGLAATEYALLTAVVGLVVLVAIGQLSDAVSGTMQRTSDCLDGTSVTSIC